MDDPLQIVRDYRQRVLDGIEMTEEDDRLVAEALTQQAIEEAKKVKERTSKNEPLTSNQLDSLFGSGKKK